MTLTRLPEKQLSNHPADPDFSQVCTPATPPVVVEVPTGLITPARDRKLDKQLILWLLLRAWNDGQGGRPGIVEDTPELRRWLGHFYRKSTLYGRLRAGKNILWRIIRLRNGQKALLLTGGGKLAERWDCGPIMRRMVTVPVEDFTGGLQRQKAALYAAEVTVRTRNGRPISRKRLEHRTGVKPRTQQNYDAAACIVTRPNWSTTPRHVERNGQDHYTMRLPNSYSTPYWSLSTWGKAKQHNATRTTTSPTVDDVAVLADGPKVRYVYKLPSRSPTPDAPVRLLVNRRRRIWHELPELRIPDFCRLRADRPTPRRENGNFGSLKKGPTLRTKRCNNPAPKRVVTTERQRGLFGRAADRLDRRGYGAPLAAPDMPTPRPAGFTPDERAALRRLRDAHWNHHDFCNAVNTPPPVVVEVVEARPVPPMSTSTPATTTTTAAAPVVELVEARPCWNCAKRHVRGHQADGADGMTWWTCAGCAGRPDVLAMLERLLG